MRTQTDSQPLVTVVVPTFNRAHKIRRTLDSIVDQTYRNLEVIVVDDGSRDDTRRVVADLGYPRVKYVHQQNAGASSARNTGIRHASGQYVGFLDSDDVWRRRKVERQVEFMEANPSYALVLCEMDVVENGRSGVVGTTALSTTHPNDGWIFESFLEDMTVTCSIMLFRGSALADIGPFDTTLATAEDKDLVLRTASRYQVGVVPEVLLDYEKGPDSLSHTVASRNSIRAIQKVSDYAPKLAIKHEDLMARRVQCKLLSYAEDLLWAGKYAEARAMLDEYRKTGATRGGSTLWLKTYLYQLMKRSAPRPDPEANRRH